MNVLLKLTLLLALLPILTAPVNATTFNVFASIDSDYVGDCVARYEGFHAVQANNVDPADYQREWDLTGELEMGGECQASTWSSSKCKQVGIVPATTFLSCETQHDHTCINPSGPYFWAHSSATFSASFIYERADSDCHRILCVGYVH